MISNLHSFIFVISLVSLSHLSTDLLATALPAVASTDDSAPCAAFSKLVGVTRSRSNALGNASPSRSLLEQTLSWSSTPSVEPMPSSGNVSSYTRCETAIKNVAHEKRKVAVARVEYEPSLAMSPFQVNVVLQIDCMLLSDSIFPLSPRCCGAEARKTRMKNWVHIFAWSINLWATHLDSPPTRIWAMSWKMAALTTNSIGAMTQ